MKIEFTELKDAITLIKKLNTEKFGDYCFFFPLDINIKNTDSHGVILNESSKFDNICDYGLSTNKLITGVVYDGYDVSLGYASSVNMFDFKFTEYLEITEQPKLSSSELQTLKNYDCCLANKIIISNSKFKL